MKPHRSHVLAACCLLAGVLALSLTSGCVGATGPSPEEDLGEVSQGVTVGCYDSPGTSGYVGVDDLYYTGPISTIDNVRFYRYPRNGTCGGDSYTNGSALIEAANAVAAAVSCLSLTGGVSLDASLWTGLAGYWLCYYEPAG